MLWSFPHSSFLRSRHAAHLRTAHVTCLAVQDGKVASLLGLGETLPLAKLLGVSSPLHLQQQAACKEIVHSGLDPSHITVCLCTQVSMTVSSWPHADAAKERQRPRSPPRAAHLP